MIRSEKDIFKIYKRKYPNVPYELSTASVISKKDGKLHSYDDAPAIIQIAGPDMVIRVWYKNGSFHRENDKPAFIHPNGKKEYWYEGKEYDPRLDTHKKQTQRINKLTSKKSSKQKTREDLLKEFIVEVLNT